MPRTEASSRLVSNTCSICVSFHACTLAGGPTKAARFEVVLAASVKAISASPSPAMRARKENVGISGATRNSDAQPTPRMVTMDRVSTSEVPLVITVLPPTSVRNSCMPLKLAKPLAIASITATMLNPTVR